MNETKNIFQGLGYENSKLQTFNELIQTEKIYLYSKLSGMEMPGLPVASVRKDGELCFIAAEENMHTLCLGSTRSGKTTSYIIPNIHVLAKRKNRANMLITDPKGEIYQHTAAMLEQEGYQVLVVNFRDYLHSEYINPFTSIYRKYQECLDVFDSIETVEDTGRYIYQFRGKVFQSEKSVQAYAERYIDMLLLEVRSGIDELAASLITIENEKDPFWEESARELLKAFLWAMLEDGLPEEQFSFRTISKILNTFQRGDVSDGGYFFRRGESSNAYKYANGVTFGNAPNTQGSIFGTFKSKIAPYQNAASQMITSANSFDLAEKMNNGSVAIFIVFSDENKANFTVVSQLVAEIYHRLMKMLENSAKLSLETPFYFLLDEFGNFPRLNDMSEMVSTCGGRNIWLTIILQSYAQLYRAYGREIGEIIKDNLNMHIFFGTNNSETKAEFSRECGEQTILSPLSAMRGSGNVPTEFISDVVPVVPKSSLDALQVGECYVTRFRHSVLFSRFERSYLSPELRIELKRLSEYQAAIDPFSEEYCYQLPEKSEVERSQVPSFPIGDDDDEDDDDKEEPPHFLSHFFDDDDDDDDSGNKPCNDDPDLW